MGLEYELALIKNDDTYTQPAFDGDGPLDVSIISGLSKSWSIPADGRVGLSFTIDFLMRF
jgi:hypothetical protein